MAAGIGSTGGDAADLYSAWRRFLLGHDQCLGERSALAAGMGTAGADAADSCSA